MIWHGNWLSSCGHQQLTWNHLWRFLVTYRLTWTIRRCILPLLNFTSIFKDNCMRMWVGLFDSLQGACGTGTWHYGLQYSRVSTLLSPTLQSRGNTFYGWWNRSGSNAQLCWKVYSQQKWIVMNKHVPVLTKVAVGQTCSIPLLHGSFIFFNLHERFLFSYSHRSYIIIIM